MCFFRSPKIGRLELALPFCFLPELEWAYTYKGNGEMNDN